MKYKKITMKESDMLKAGKKIERLIDKYEDKTVLELSRILKTSPQNIYNWINGKSAIPPKHIRIICEYFDREISQKDLRPDIFYFME